MSVPGHHIMWILNTKTLDVVRKVYGGSEREEPPGLRLLIGQPLPRPPAIA
jgi:hypothetical protein